jgi:hypothetical protein
VSGGRIAPESARTRADPQTSGLQIIDLRRLKARHLDPMLREQAVEWRLKLDWN